MSQAFQTLFNHVMSNKKQPIGFFLRVGKDLRGRALQGINKAFVFPCLALGYHVNIISAIQGS